MATEKFTDLPTYTNPDAVNDIIPIVDVANNASKKISRNNYLGITGNPVGDSDAQSISNKTLRNSNSYNILDGSISIQNTSDTSKFAHLSLAGNTTGTTRTYTFPDVTDTLVSLTAAQTLTNKTLTSPTINAPSITNATITADVLAGFSSANTGTIYGIAITNSTIGPSALSTGTIKLGFAQITSNFVLSASQTTPTQVTGLSVTVTVPTGGRTIQITAFCGALQPAAGTALWGIWDGVVNSGTQIGQANTNSSVSAVTAMAIVTPGAGSKTYNVGVWNSGSNNTTVGATSVVQPAFILVEAI